ncbi:MAG: hypothetical protein ACKO1O_10425 [Erythrobacter sp.]
MNALLPIFLRFAMVAVAVAATYYGFLIAFAGFDPFGVIITAFLLCLMCGIGVVTKRVDQATSKGSKMMADALTVIVMFVVAYFIWPVRL